MATQTGLGDIITLTNTDTASHLTITDVYPALHIPASGSVALPFAGEVAESYSNGVIRGFLGGAQGLYGTTSGVNASGNHPTKLTAVFSETSKTGKTEYAYVEVPKAINAATEAVWIPNEACTITDISFNCATIAEAGTLLFTATRITGTKNLLTGAHDLNPAGAAPDAVANTFVAAVLTGTAADLAVTAGTAVRFTLTSNNAGHAMSNMMLRITYTID